MCPVQADRDFEQRARQSAALEDALAAARQAERRERSAAAAASSSSSSGQAAAGHPPHRKHTDLNRSRCGRLPRSLQGLSVQLCL